MNTSTATSFSKTIKQASVTGVNIFFVDTVLRQTQIPIILVNCWALTVEVRKSGKKSDEKKIKLCWYSMKSHRIWKQNESTSRQVDKKVKVLFKEKEKENIGWLVRI